MEKLQDVPTLQGEAATTADEDVWFATIGSPDAGSSLRVQATDIVRSRSDQLNI